MIPEYIQKLLVPNIWSPSLYSESRETCQSLPPLGHGRKINLLAGTGSSCNKKHFRDARALKKKIDSYCRLYIFISVAKPKTSLFSTVDLSCIILLLLFLK